VAKDGKVGDRKLIEGRDRVPRWCPDDLAVLEKGNAPDLGEVSPRVKARQQLRDGLFALTENDEVDAVVQSLLDVVLDEVIPARNGARA
jgi:hypothetical protein